jgi:hypothetical protein
MPWPRVFTLNLLAGFPGLLDNKIVGVSFDHSLDCLAFVPRHNHEVGDMRGDAVVLGRWKFDRFHAGFVRAPTVKRKCLPDTMLLSTFLDALIDRTKDLLVAGRRIREIHRQIVERFVSEAKGLRCSFWWFSDERCPHWRPRAH